MANLAAYIDFNANFIKGPGGSALGLHDPNNYPTGVAATLIGYFVITQPDTITITGNFGTPDIYWNGTNLVDAAKELRLRADGEFQQGTYTITYHISAPGYDETILTRTFNLSYLSPDIVLDPNLDFFTPVISVTDDTDYSLTNINLVSVSRAWSADIISVQGTDQTISATTQTFNLSYLGSYYDAEYDVSLAVTLLYRGISADDWALLTDTTEIDVVYQAEIPPTLIELLALLTALKAQLDTAGCICGSGCPCPCDQLRATYTLAVSLYTHIVERGRAGITTDLGPYVVQLQKVLNNCVTPTYVHTNEVIPPYDWGGGGGSGNFLFFKQMIVGSGVNSAPADGAIDYVDVLLIGKRIQTFLDGLLLGDGLVDRQAYTFDSITGTITWTTNVFAPQLISIYTF